MKLTKLLTLGDPRSPIFLSSLAHHVFPRKPVPAPVVERQGQPGQVLSKCAHPGPPSGHQFLAVSAGVVCSASKLKRTGELVHALRKTGELVLRQVELL